MGRWIQPSIFFCIGLIGRLGDLDFIMTRINDPGWLKLLIDHPFWLTALFVGYGFYLIWKIKQKKHEHNEEMKTEILSLQLDRYLFWESDCGIQYWINLDAFIADLKTEIRYKEIGIARYRERVVK